MQASTSTSCCVQQLQPARPRPVATAHSRPALLARPRRGRSDGGSPQPHCQRRRGRPLAPATALGSIEQLAAASASMHAAIAAAVAGAPPALGPVADVVATVAADVADMVGLHPSTAGLVRLAALWYALLARPGPLVGLLDFYVANPLAALLGPKFSEQDFTLRGRLGGGNYGQVYEGLLNGADGLPDAYSAELTPEQKRRRVVLKKTNMDAAGIRTNFLKAGTMAQGAAETGAVEGYLGSRIMRHPTVRGAASEYLGSFVAKESSGSIASGSQWLVYRFESDATLADALNGALGPFPEAVAELVLGRRSEGMETEKRDAAVVKGLMKRLLVGLDKLHSLGIVHRDVKPENVLLTAEGDVKIIDFGAACDMSTGINFNPEYGMLDPRYSAPEELVMPKNFPRAPPPVLAATLAPLAWWWGRPDLFDSYSAGAVLMQMAVPQLRSTNAQRSFNSELANCEYDLDLWRRSVPRARGMDFSLLDRQGGAGWDLACKLLCKKNALNRGRLSVAQALRHPFLLLPA